MVEDEHRLLDAAKARLHPLWADHLSLDFADTVEPRGWVAPVALPPDYQIRDYLGSYVALVAWGWHAEILEEGTALGLLRAAANDPRAAGEVFARAIVFREALYRLFWRVAHNLTPNVDDLALLTAEHADGAAHAALTPSAEGFDWSWAAHDTNLARPLWPIAWSASALLTGGDLRRVKVCPGSPGTVAPCAWLFYDTTKNRIRQWCSMADCGGKTKARRQTRRRRAARAADA